MILAGDIGGTHCRLALFDREMNPVTEKTYASRDFNGLAAVAGKFMEGLAARVERACFGVPGPVRGGRVHITNLPWEINAADLARETDLPAVKLLNDLEAFAYGLEELQDSEFLELNPAPEEPHGNRAVVAAGTGLGESGVVWDGMRWLAIPTEGGHADFAPQDALQADLLAHARKSRPHVSFESFLCGPGLNRIYEFLRDQKKEHREEDWLRGELKTGEAPAVISQAALSGKSPLASQALEVFCRIYGAEAGNLALKLLARGGVYLGGGIAPAIAPFLQKSGFLKAFCAKEKMEGLMETIPVKVVLNDRAGLLGAAHYAWQRM